ncbi:Uma2 family endonuclease [Longimicrobium sp.]|uniref:Uma2 family endonuclease n=1 Tax=Longimicrobium sp. TaxID=2029185 RepID=UPI002E2EE663|nr:Uma2 family endonuclease [Longimicrobium sp.]HEX6042411.1 Uma2 family endonuclease [Longimicrobium sp.]
MQTAATPARRSFTWDECVRMGELGILPEFGVELIDGEVRERNIWGTPRRWTYEDWERMVAGGILDEDERIELVDGELVRMTPIGDRHMYTVDLIGEYLWSQMRGHGIVRVQSPLKFHTGEGPVPDLVLLRMSEDRYRNRKAGPWDALLVVEVADSSMARDLGKAELYARAAIPEYWIVDVNRPGVMVHLAPVGGEYSDVRRYGYGQAFTSPALTGRDVRVEEVLGPA